MSIPGLGSAWYHEYGVTYPGWGGWWGGWWLWGWWGMGGLTSQLPTPTMGPTGGLCDRPWGPGDMSLTGVELGVGVWWGM